MIRALLIDLSGTLHIGSDPTPSAVKALQRLRDAGIPFRFCSNTSKESTDSLTERLRSMGFDVRSDGPGRELWTSIGAVTAALHKFGLNRYANHPVPSSYLTCRSQTILPALRLGAQGG